MTDVKQSIAADARSRPLVFVNQIAECLNDVIASHSSRPQVIFDPEPREPWRIHEDSDVLVTRAFDGWKLAPEKPQALPPRLRWVQTMSAGIDFYPRWLLEGRLVTTGAGLTAPVISEYVIAAIIRVEKPIQKLAARSQKDWFQTRLGRIEGRRLGIFGYGAIGKNIAQLALALGMDVMVCRRSDPTPQDGPIQFCSSIAELAGWSDHLALAAPATEETRGIFSRGLIGIAKPGLHLINVSRGDLVDQDALIEGLQGGAIGHATLDVTTPEPLPDGHPLYAKDNVIVTPHIAWSGADPENGLGLRILRSLDAILEGYPPEAEVNLTRGY